MPPARTPIADRFYDKVEKTDTCWLWTAAKVRNGYGIIGAGGAGNGFLYAHRVSYELSVGPIPDGLFLDHLCRVRHCVNPEHLEPVTTAENCRRAAAAVTHCPQGHVYDEANTYVYTHHKHGWTMRFCRACGREKARARRAS
jgi:hypothetical protein